MKETDLVRQVIQFLNLRGHLVQRTQSGMVKVTNAYGKQHMMKFAQAGTADITGCSKLGKFIAVECKIRPNKPTELQEKYLSEIRSRGGIALVAYDLSDVEQCPDLLQ
jgi:hypothetical protein